jgi:pyruvate/2-oxoglutarate dehydrogenase complex dihydrolipoamide dehydrogenase (E3) component
MKRVHQRKRDIVNSFRSGSESKLKAGGVESIIGEGSFTGSHSLAVKMSDGSGTRSVSADLIFINAGERPVLPKLPGILSSIPQPLWNSMSFLPTSLYSVVDILA